VQTSRILLYAGSFLCGVAIGATELSSGLLAERGALAARWRLWAAIALVPYLSILGLVYVRHNWLADINSPPLAWSAAYGLAFAAFSAAMAFAVPALLLRFAKSRWPLLDALQPSAYGVFLLHYIPIIWTQYAVYPLALPPGVKFVCVFAVTLATSWLVTIALRRIPLVGRMI
jgi:surface polysaccharide O-acyltransferase-like enzyme